MPRLSKSEIHSDFSSASETWSEYRAQVIAFYDNYPHSELNDHITREFNKKIRDLGQDESLYISPYNAGLRYIGDGVFTVDPLSFNPYFYIDAASSMLGVLESPSLDLNPAVPSTLDIITATRAGTATYTDASGNIQTASPNTVRVDHVQGEELTPTKFQRVGYTDFSSGWSKSKVTEVDGGGFNGQVSKVLTVTSDNIIYRQNSLTSAGVVYTASIYARLISGTGTLKINHQNSPSGSDTVVSISSQWQRFEVDFIGLGGSTAVGLRGMLTGDVIEVSSLQVEEGTTASDFVANTTGSPKYFAAATYAPRVPMILVEPAATNFIDYSDLNTAGLWYSVGFNITQNAILSPDGLNNGTKLEQTSTTRNFSGAFISSSTGTSVTYSFWVKKGSGDTHLNGFIIRNHSRSPYSMRGSINLETGEIIQNDFGAGNLIVESYPNGWFKVKATRDTDISVGDDIRIYPPYFSSDISNEIGQYVYTFGHQLEYGSVATSYTPTSGSAVTRAKDLLIIDGSDFTDFYNQSEGTFYQEVSSKIIAETNWYLSVSDNTNNSGMVFTRSAGTHRVAVQGQIEKSFSTAVLGQIHRLAMSHDSSASEFRASVDGVNSNPNPMTGVTIPTNLTQLNIGSRYNGTAMCGHIKRVIFWPHYSDNI